VVQEKDSMPQNEILPLQSPNRLDGAKAGRSKQRPYVQINLVGVLLAAIDSDLIS
jgi:hypothetical protein